MSGRRSKRNSFKEKQIPKPTDITTKETRREQHKIHDRLPRKNYNYLRNIGET